MKVFIEADSITKPRMSGIGHACLEIIKAFDRLAETDKNLQPTIIVPFGTRKYVRQYNFRHVRVRSLWPGGRLVNYILARTSLPLPVDMWFGRGVYIFPNYKNWYVPFSQSLTFVHDIAFKLYPETLNKKNQRYLETNLNRWLRRTDRVLCISQAAAAEFTENFPAYQAKAAVVYLGVDSAVYKPQPPAMISSMRDKYHLPQNYFLSVGNIEPRKNLDRLLDAYRQYADKTQKPMALVVVGGDGWNNQATITKINDLQQTGYAIIRPEAYVPDEDLPALYCGAAALVQIALHEGFGIPSLQAQACGTPVIASDLPVFHEILSAANTTFVAPTDVTAIAATLAKKQSRHAPRPTKFTWQNTVTELLSLMKVKPEQRA